MIKYKRYIILSIMIITVMIVISYLAYNNKVDHTYEEVQFLIGMSHPNLIDEWQIDLHDSMDAYAKRYTNMKLIYANAGSSSFKQISDVNKLLDYGIDLLIISVNDSNALGSVLDEVRKKIPVIVLDKEIGSYDYSLFIGPQYYDIGTLGAKSIVEISEGKECRVVTINGPIEDNSVTEINNGLIDGLEEYDHIEIVGNIYEDWLEADVTSDFNSLVEEVGDIDVVFVQSSELAFGVLTAMKASGNHKPVIMLSKYLSDKYLTYIDIDEVDTIIYTPIGGIEAIDYAIELLEKENQVNSVPKRIIMKNYIVTKETKELFRYHSFANKRLSIGYIETGLFDESNIKNIFSEDYELNYYGENKNLSKSDKKSNLIEQQQIFVELLDAQTDIIILKPELNIDWEPLFKRAKEQETLVICLGNLPKLEINLSEANVVYIGPDYLDQGKKLANYLINEVYSTNYDIGILQIVDGANFQMNDEKTKSLMNQISGYSRINLISSISIDTEVPNYLDELRTSIEFSLDKYRSDINVVYIHNSILVDGVKEILEDNQLDDIIIISSNDNGVIHGANIMNYQVSPTILYKEQLSTIVNNYYQNGQIDIERIFLPNKESF